MRSCRCQEPSIHSPELTGQCSEEGIQSFLHSKQDPCTKGAGAGSEQTLMSKLLCFQELCGSVVKQSLLKIKLNMLTIE